MNKFQTRKDLKEEFGSNVLSSFLILIGAIISIIFGNVTKDLFDTNVSVWLYIIACYVVPFIFMVLEFWLVARTKRIVKEMNNLQ
jgi:purine-cytosine permease-like protein